MFNVENYNSLKCGVYRPDSTHESAKIILPKMFILIRSGCFKCQKERKHDGLYTNVLLTFALQVIIITQLSGQTHWSN